MPKLVVHCKKERYDVYIGRPSKWGNPFSHLSNTLAQFKVDSRDEAITKYEEWILTQQSLLDSIEELKGKVLGCWCDPLPCHGHILVKLARKFNVPIPDHKVLGVKFEIEDLILAKEVISLTHPVDIEVVDHPGNQQDYLYSAPLHDLRNVGPK